MSENTMLDQLKKVNVKTREALVQSMLKDLKVIAKRVLEEKYRMTVLLKKLWVQDKESKQIIDWVNSLPDVVLSSDDECDIEDDVDGLISWKKEKAEEKVDSITIDNSAFSSYLSYTGNYPDVTNISNNCDRSVNKFNTQDNSIMYCSTTSWMNLKDY